MSYAPTVHGPDTGGLDGWCFGEITRSNTDGRRVVEKGVPAKFFVYYEIDEDESKHKLELKELGHQEVPGAWVLLEQA